MTNSVFHTRVTEFLTMQKVPYKLLHHQTPATTIEDAARQRGITPRMMVKSIVLRDMDDNYALACVPGDMQADPKKVREILKCRRMTCLNLSEIPKITGYEIGTVAPVSLLTSMPIFFANQIRMLDEVTISSGSNMAGLRLRTEHLISLCSPYFADITR